MGRPRTSWELERLATIAKAREAARKAAALAATPKPYQPKPQGGTAYFRSIEDENLFVLMPIPAKATAAIISNPAPIGGLTAAAAGALANSVLVSFKGNHQAVMRIRFSIAKTAPTVKNTPWGTRVVDHWDESFTLPFGAPENGSIEAAKTAFNQVVESGGSLASLLGTRDGNQAELIYGKRVLAKKVVA